MDKDMYLNGLGRRIKAYREAMGLSQEELASKIGYTGDYQRSAMSKVEHGKVDLPNSKIITLANVFGVPVSALLDEDPGEDFDIWTEYRKLSPDHQDMVKTMIRAFRQQEGYS